MNKEIKNMLLGIAIMLAVIVFHLLSYWLSFKLQPANAPSPILVILLGNIILVNQW